MRQTPIAHLLIEAAAAGELVRVLDELLEARAPSKRWWLFQVGDLVADKNAISSLGHAGPGGIGRVVHVDRINDSRVLVQWERHPHTGMRGRRVVHLAKELVKLQRPKERDEL